VHEVRWNKGGTVRARDYNFFHRKGNEIHQLGTGFFVHHRIVSALKRVDFVMERVLYIILRGRWCNIIDLNVHTPSNEKNDDSEDSFYEGLEQIFYHFSKYHMKILLDFNAKVESENIFKPTIGNRIYFTIVMIMVFELKTLPLQKIYLTRARCSLTEIFISTPGLLI